MYSIEFPVAVHDLELPQPHLHQCSGPEYYEYEVIINLSVPIDIETVELNIQVCHHRFARNMSVLFVRMTRRISSGSLNAMPHIENEQQLIQRFGENVCGNHAFKERGSR